MRVTEAALAAVLAALVLAPTAQAQQNDDLESKLRAALRQATAQIRDLEDQNATLQTKAAQSDAQGKALADKVAADAKEMASLHGQIDGDEKSLADTNRQLTDTNTALDGERGTNAKLTDALAGETRTAQDRDAEAKRLDAALVDTRKRNLDCEARNADLFRIGNEILDLYDKKGVFASLFDHEPVTGLKRVELENAVQGYKDKLRDKRLVAPNAIVGQ